MNQRIQRHPYFSLFDGADAAISTAQRPLTITPIQGLFSMNSELVHEAAAAWSKRLRESQPNEPRRVQSAFRSARGRSPTADELARARSYLASAAKLATPNEALASFLRTLLATNEFLFFD